MKKTETQGVPFKLDKTKHKEFKKIGIDEDTSMQDMLTGLTHQFMDKYQNGSERVRAKLLKDIKEAI